MKKKNIVATTVKIKDEVYTEFKVLAIRQHLTLQNFMDKCIHLYISESTFRDEVHGCAIPVLSSTGSFSITVITSSKQF